MLKAVLGKLRKNRYVLLLLIAVVYVTGNFTMGFWKTSLFYGDSNGYYMHLVSFFVNHDVGDYDKTITTLRQVNPNSADPREDIFGIRLTEKGRRSIKYPLGVPLMEMPFFLIAHCFAKLSGNYASDGWSLPYRFMIGLSTIFYVLIGFNLLMKVLEKYFRMLTQVFVVLAIAFATNLFFNSTCVVMAHGFLFFNYCLLIYFTVKFYDKPDTVKAISIGIAVGLITLCRIPEIISAIIPLLWGISSGNTLKNRIYFFTGNYKFLLVACASFLIVFSIQSSYWYYVSGHLFSKPYPGEQFNFLKPQILNGWFHFSNGWLIYTPIMAFSLIGWFFLRKYFPAPQLAILVFVGIHVYIHYSWHAWTYYPGLGSRPMVETYPMLALCLGAFFSFCMSYRWLFWVPPVAIAFFTWLNFFQTWQAREGIIWPERGNAAFYFETFGTMTPTINSLRAFDTRMLQPDSANLKYIQTLASESFEDTIGLPVSSEITHTGQYSLMQLQQFSNWKPEISLTDVGANDFLYVELYAFMPDKYRIWNRDLCELMVIQLYDERNKMKREISIKPSSYIGNKDYSIWNAGESERWGKASFYVRLPRNINPGWKAKAFIFNPSGQHLYVDDFSVKHYKRRK